MPKRQREAPKSPSTSQWVNPLLEQNAESLLTPYLSHNQHFWDDFFINDAKPSILNTKGNSAEAECKDESSETDVEDCVDRCFEKEALKECSPEVSIVTPPRSPEIVKQDAILVYQDEDEVTIQQAIHASLEKEEPRIAFGTFQKHLIAESLEKRESQRMHGQMIQALAQAKAFKYRRIQKCLAKDAKKWSHESLAAILNGTPVKESKCQESREQDLECVLGEEFAKWQTDHHYSWDVPESPELWKVEIKDVLQFIEKSDKQTHTYIRCNISAHLSAINAELAEYRATVLNM